MPIRSDSTVGKGKEKGVQSLHLATLKMQHQKHTRWKPLDWEFYKVNYDGADFAEQGRAGLGVIIRNSDGEVMASMSQQVQFPTTVMQVEALAMRKAAKFALEIGVNKVVLEGDLEIVYKDLKNNGPSLALHSHLIQDVKALFPLFSNICFSHVGWAGNKATHSLARRAILSRNLNVWMEDVPPNILDMVQADFSSH